MNSEAVSNYDALSHGSRVASTAALASVLDKYRQKELCAMRDIFYI